MNWVRPTSGLGLALGLLCSLLQAAPLEPVPELSGLDRGATVPAELYQLHDTHALAQALVERVFRLTRAKDTRPKLGPLKRTEPVHHFDLQKDARLLMHLKLEAVTDPQRFSGYVTRGFLNLHQTGSTGGLDKPEVRALLEDDLALLRLEEEYNPDPSNRVHELRPKYLVLDLTGEVVVGGRRHDAAHYGNLVFVFKEQVKQRATWTYRDSLDLVQAHFQPTIQLSFGVWTFDEEKYRTGVLEEYYRLCLAGTFEDALLRARPYPQGYLEAQVWGPLELSDVNHVLVLEAELPAFSESQAFQYLTERLGIPVYTYEMATRWDRPEYRTLRRVSGSDPD
ncbi:MAG: hypothetical protein A2284_11800 [Deltaproteobacteria bacterium RIFOXYA12_FULL_61_11]|nr:MAG: hypothetical protein A2284_11800 [Deltaproteobacteria bacterium RIFOXYA12_FULL_61_11]